MFNSLSGYGASDVSKEFVSSGGYGAVPVRVIGPWIDGAEAGSNEAAVWFRDTGSNSPVVANVSEDADPVLGGGPYPW